jgi:hypothetical protein
MLNGFYPLKDKPYAKPLAVLVLSSFLVRVQINVFTIRGGFGYGDK